MKKTQPKPCQNQKLHLDYSLEERLLSRLSSTFQQHKERLLDRKQDRMSRAGDGVQVKSKRYA